MELSYAESSSGNQRFIRKYPEVVVITVLVGIYLFLANYYAWSSTFQNFFFTTSGGSDPYFNWITIQHFLQTGHWLMFEPSLNYPIGTTNPRNPFFQVMTVFIAVLMSPFMNIQNAAFFTFEELDAFFGALLIIPVYLMGKEVFGKKGGFVASILYLLMPSNVSTGYLSDGRIHTPELFFVLFFIYFFQRAIVSIDKDKIVEKLFPPTRILTSIRSFYNRNRLATIYAMLSGTSLAALMMSWQGYAYAVVILLLYVLVQYVYNLFIKRPSDYLVYLSAISILLGFFLGAYYYLGIGNYSVWFTPVLLLGILVIVMGFVFVAIRGRPWIISVPIIAILGAILLGALAIFDAHAFNTLLSGDGYFIKTKVYQTIAEAASLPLGEYISSFGAFEFILGVTGLAYAVYLFIKEKKDSMFFFLVFSLVSIYMSFEAARFNITAAPAYAILGAGLLMYFAHLVKLYDMKKRSGAPLASVGKSLRGNISWVHTVFVVIIVLMVISSGLGLISSAIPSNTAAKYNQEIYNVIPSSLQPANFSANQLYYVGATGNLISNSTQPLALSYSWLATQDANLPLQDKPAYVSWWDYGFQELQQGLHPTVADDFQQGYEVAGQILLAQNQSQILALFIARTIQVEFDSSQHSFNTPVNNVLVGFFGSSEVSLLASIYQNPLAYKAWIMSKPSVYGDYSSSITSTNAYFALVTGQLASQYSLNTLVDAYTALSQVTGISIKYIQVPNTLFPSSINNTGTFYAPAYLTDTPAYVSSGGAIVPTNYYNILVQTTNGTYTLNNVPTAANVTGESLQYTSAFYNTTIYRMQIGYPGSAVGLSSGIPGLAAGATNYTIMPAWDMSNFEIVYELIPWNPYTDYAAHPNAWQDIPLQQAYYDLVKGIGTPVIFPSATQMVSTANPIMAYYPGAIITGRVTTPGGQGVGGINVTLFDQYGIPHDVVHTNSAGYYNITAVPGNDTVVFSTGTLNTLYLYGKNVLKTTNIYISTQQAERTALGINMTTGLPNYYVTENYQVSASKVSGTAFYNYQTVKNANATIPGDFISKRIMTGTVFLVNSTYGVNVSLPLVNGVYSSSDVLPYSYELSIFTDGTYYANLLQGDVVVGANVAFPLLISFDSIFVNTTTASGLSGGYIVKASDGTTIYSNTTGGSGHANLWVQPGTYTIQAYKGSSQTGVSTTTFTGWGQNYSVNLSATLSGIVSGTLSGAPSGTILYLYPNGQISSTYSTIIGPGGAFSTEVPYGVYTLYASSSGNSFTKTITVQSNFTLTGSMSLAFPITVSTYLPGITAYSGSYEFMGSSAFFTYSYSGPTPYTILLPEGMYGISSLTVYLGSIKEGFQNVYLVGARNVSITQQYTNTATITLSDSSNSGVMVGSGISILNSSGNPVYFSKVSNGQATVYYLNGSKDLTTYAMSSLYTSTTMSLSSNTQSYSMTPVTVGITISFVNNSIKLRGSTNLVLKGTNTYYLSGSETGISASVFPGIYVASASNSTATLNLSDPVIVVPNKVTQSVTLLAAPYANLSINATSYEIFNSLGTVVNNSKPLPAGNYLVYAYLNSSVSPEVSWKSYYLTSNMNVTPSLQSADMISLENSLGISAGNYTLSISGGVANVSTTSILLPAGVYNVKYYDTITNATGSYIVSGSGSFNTYYTNKFNVIVTSTKINTMLTGTVTFNGKAMQNTVIQILSTEGTVVARTATNTYGIFSVSIPTGSWAIYALNNASSTGYYGGVTIPAFSGTYYDNFSLKPAYAISVIVTVGSKIYNTNVQVTLYPNSINVNSSKANLLLPQGNYSFSANISQNALAYNGSLLSVSYSVNNTIYVNSNMSITLALSQVVTGKITIIQNGTYPNLVTGSNVTNSTEVYFNVTNGQNVQQSVTLTSGSNQWHILFNQSYLNLAPGQKVAVSALVYALNNPPSGINAVPVNLTYSGSTASGSFDVNVAPRVGFTATLNSPFGLPQDGKLIYNITLENTGNTAIAINGSIVDKNTINLYDWNAAVVYNGKVSTTFNLPYGQSISLSMILTPNGTAYAEGAPIKLAFTTMSYGNNITVPLSFTVEYPYASISPFPQGQGIISNYTGNPLSTVVTGLLVIAVTVIGGIAIAVYRGRRFRR
ncbi:MAG: hypothetical protein QW597_00080 [Thermoplasmataceae archaeon]